MTAAQLSKLDTLLHRSPFLYIRADSVHIYYSYAYPDEEKLVINRDIFLDAFPYMEYVRIETTPPVQLFRMKTKIQYIQTLNSLPPLRSRIMYLSTPATFYLSQILEMYNFVYSDGNRAYVQQELAHMCNSKSSDCTKFSFPKSLWFTKTVWPDWCEQKSAGRDDQLYFVDSEESSLSSLDDIEDTGHSIDQPASCKRIRFNSPTPVQSPIPDMMDDGTDVGPVLEIATLSSFTTRGILRIMVDRIASKNHPLPSTKDLTRPVHVSDNRISACDFFFPVTDS